MVSKHIQVTCLCTAYNFPHRIGSGKCTGAMWAESYFELLKECCENCNCNNDTAKWCDVAAGIEDIKYCEGYIEHLHYQPSIRLPCTQEEYFSKYHTQEYEE